MPFGLDQPTLFFQGRNLSLKSSDFLVILRDTRRQLRADFTLFKLAHAKHVLLVGNGLARARVAAAAELGWPLDRGTPHPLGLKPRALRHQLFDAQVRKVGIGARHPVIKLHQQLALLDVLAILNENLRDHAAARMRNALHP